MPHSARFQPLKQPASCDRSCSSKWSPYAAAFLGLGYAMQRADMQPAGDAVSHSARAENQADALDVASGLVAERVFGFAGAIGGEGADLDNARALGNSLLFCWLLPFFCCFLFYFGAAHSSWASVNCLFRVLCRFIWCTSS